MPSCLAKHVQLKENPVICQSPVCSFLQIAVQQTFIQGLLYDPLNLISVEFEVEAIQEARILKHLQLHGTKARFTNGVNEGHVQLFN